MKKALKINLLVLLPAGFIMFSKAAMVNYSIAYLFDMGMDSWIATFIAFGIRIVSLFGSNILRKYPLSVKESTAVGGLFSILTSFGFFSIYFIHNVYVVFIASIFYGIGVVSQIINQGNLMTAINNIIENKRDFSNVFAGADAMKILINMIFSALLALIVSGYNVGMALLVIGILHLAMGFWMIIKSGGFKELLSHHSSINKKKKKSDSEFIRRLSRLSFWIMLSGVWSGSVPTVEILGRFNLDSSWVALLTLVTTVGFSFSFLVILSSNFM